MLKGLLAVLIVLSLSVGLWPVSKMQTADPAPLTLEDPCHHGVAADRALPTDCGSAHQSGCASHLGCLPYLPANAAMMRVPGKASAWHFGPARELVGPGLSLATPPPILLA